MKKTMNRFLFLILLAVVSVPLVTLASVYTSTLQVSPGGHVTGAVRQYDEKNHSVTIRADELISPGNADVNKLVIEIGSKSLFGSFKQQSRKVQSLVEGSTRTTEMGSIGSGKKWYRFSAHSTAGTSEGGLGTYYSGIRSDYVVMRSY